MLLHTQVVSIISSGSKIHFDEKSFKFHLYAYLLRETLKRSLKSSILKQKLFFIEILKIFYHQNHIDLKSGDVL
eukprot:UN18323